MSRETLQINEFACSSCGRKFASRDRNQLASSLAGRNVFCSVECRKAKDAEMQRKRPGRHQSGPCPTCGEMFRAKKRDKTYCSLECYLKSDSLMQRLKECNAKKAKDWVCLQCGDDAPRKRKFCNDFCRRRFFAERFDRFIANPEDIALPQNFDEFLNRNELPCLIDGCDWIGVGLSHHVNFHHGITPDKFKELVGFNKTTALMGVSARETRSKTMKRLIDEGVIKPCSFPLQECNPSRAMLRLEGREHWKKAMALSGGFSRFVEAGVAHSKSEEHRMAASKRLKRTIAETPRIMLTCCECGQEYETLATYSKRSKYCGQKCRNKHNRMRRQLVLYQSASNLVAGRPNGCVV